MLQPRNALLAHPDRDPARAFHEAAAAVHRAPEAVARMILLPAAELTCALDALVLPDRDAQGLALRLHANAFLGSNLGKALAGACSRGSAARPAG